MHGKNSNKNGKKFKKNLQRAVGKMQKVHCTKIQKTWQARKKGENGRNV